MQFEDLVFVGFLLALFFVASHDVEFMDHDKGGNTAVVYQGVPAAAALLHTRHDR